MHNVIEFCPFQKSVANCGLFTRVANFTGFAVLSDTDSVNETNKKDFFCFVFRKPYGLLLARSLSY